VKTIYFKKKVKEDGTEYLEIDDMTKHVFELLDNLAEFNNVSVYLNKIVDYYNNDFHLVNFEYLTKKESICNVRGFIAGYECASNLTRTQDVQHHTVNIYDRYKQLLFKFDIPNYDKNCVIK
jgi:hypothetical protein